VETSRAHWAGALPVLPAAEGRGFFVPAPRGRTWLALAIVLFTACGASADTRSTPDTVIDDAGREVAVDAPAFRIVSTLPSVTELIIALGAADRLLVRTAFDMHPQIAHLPSFGRTLSPTPEALVAYHPDLVIRSADASMGGRTPLEMLGLRVYVADVQSTADIATTLDRLGVLLGLRARADSLRRALESGLDSVRIAVSGRPRPTVLYLIWPDPPQTAGRGTFIDEVITAAGGRNAFDDLRIEWPEISLEEIVQRDPDYVVLPQGSSHATALPPIHNAPGWRDLTAFRERRILLVDTDLFNRPGPRVVEAARTLAAALHPEVRFP
jgi:iron complex transport system substrate-binding protein